MAKKQEQVPVVIDVPVVLAPIQQVAQLQWHCHWEGRGGCQEPAAYRVHFLEGDFQFAYGCCEGHLDKMKLMTKWQYVSHELIDYDEQPVKLRTEM